MAGPTSAISKATAHMRTAVTALIVLEKRIVTHKLQKNSFTRCMRIGPRACL